MTAAAARTFALPVPTFLARIDRATLIGAAVVVVFYLIYYFADGASPGFGARAHLGWWGWFDQSRYLASAQALWRGDLAPENHWYALGYSLLAAPFTAITTLHAFFVLDLLALLLAYLAFMNFAARMGLKSSWAAVAFVLATLADWRLGVLWSQPWNTTLGAALIWTMFALIAALMIDGASAPPRKRLVQWSVLGVVMGLVPLVRLADGLVVALCVPVLAVAALRARIVTGREIAAFVTAGLVVVLPYIALYLAIYGPAPTPYMLHTAPVGFVPSELPWKAVILLTAPQPWFPSGTALLARCPWIALSIALFAPLVTVLSTSRRLVLGLLTAVIVVYAGVYMAYVDFLPTGLWRYHNVHYFKWLLPGLALIAALGISQRRSLPRRLTIAAAVITAILLSVRIIAVPAGDAPARMVQFSGPQTEWSATYFDHSVLIDSQGRFENVYDMRVLPDDQGVRAIALRRAFAGPMTWVALNPFGESATADMKARWRSKVTVGFPCWLPPYPCQHLGP